MAISFVSSLSYLGAGGGDPLPSGYQAGDLALVFAFRDDNTAPGTGSGYTSIATGGTGIFRWNLGYKFLDAASGETIANWAGSAGVIVHIYRGAAYAQHNSDGAVDGVLHYASLTTALANSWTVLFVGTGNTDNSGAATTYGSFANRINRNANSRKLASQDSDGITSNFPGFSTAKNGTNGNWRTVSVEISSTVRGAIVATEAVDVLAAAASADRVGSIVATETNDAVAASSQLGRFGSIVAAEATDTLAAGIAVNRVGAIAASEGTDTIAAVLKPDVIGSIIASEATDTLSATGIRGRVGSLVASENNDALASASVLGRIGAIAATEANDTLAGTVKPARLGSIVASEATDVLTSESRLLVAGTLTVSEANDGLVGTGALLVRGALVAAERADTLAAAVHQARIGAIIATEAQDTLDGLGDIEGANPGATISIPSGVKGRFGFGGRWAIS